MERWKEVEKEIRKFRGYFFAGFPCLPVKEGYDYELGYGELRKMRLAEGLYGKQGVYVYYDAAGKLLYVGKSRLSFYKEMFGAEQRKRELKGRVRYIDLVPFDDYPFLCSALEDFLICQLRPCANEVGCRNEATQRPTFLPILLPAKARITTREGRVLPVPIVVPDLDDVGEFAAQRHAAGVPWKGETFGWPAEYHPERAERPLDSKMSFTPADFCIGESDVWFFSLMWEHGKDAEPLEFLEERGMMNAE